MNTTHKVLIAVVAAITLLLLLAVAVWAYDDAQKDEIAPGVKVGGVDIGGRSAASARKLIQKEVVAPLRQPIVVSYENHDYTLSPKQLKTKADVDAMVQQALDKSREGDILTRVTRYAGGSEVNVDLDPDVGYSKRAVSNFVNALSEQIDQSPEDATVYPDGSKLRPVPGKPGLGVEKDQLREEINDAAHSPGRDQTLQVPVAATKPEITKKDLPHEYPRYIFIDRSNFTLRFFHHLRLEKSYTIAVGQQGLETPAGLYHATDKQVDPSWHVPNSAWAGELAGQVIPPGPADPLKARWIGIVDGAGIHGTDDIGSLGSAASHGCVRMSIPDVEDLYDRVDVGDPIYVK